MDTNETTTATYEVPEQNLFRLKAALDKLIRKAEKLGVGSISYTVGNPKDKVVASRKEVVEGDADEAHHVNSAGEAVRYIRIYPVTVTGTTPRLAGWTFVATLEHAGEAGNILRCVPGFTLPLSFRTVAPACDHCRVQRRRLDTFVVRNEAGEHLQIGRNCVQDFVGGKDPQAVTKMAEYMRSAAELGEGATGGGGGGPDRAELVAFMAQTAAVVRKDGFLGRGAARDSYVPKVATADVVWNLLFPSSAEARTEAFKAYAKEYAPTEADIQTAKNTIDWVRGLGK